MSDAPADQPSEPRGHSAPKSRAALEQPAKKPRKNGETPWYRRAVVVGPLFLLFLVLVIGGVLLWRHSRTQEKTDDAYVDVVSEQVSPQVAGRVLEVLVDDNQEVQFGQPLL